MTIEVESESRSEHDTSMKTNEFDLIKTNTGTRFRTRHILSQDALELVIIKMQRSGVNMHPDLNKMDAKDLVKFVSPYKQGKCVTITTLPHVIIFILV